MRLNPENTKFLAQSSYGICGFAVALLLAFCLFNANLTAQSPIILTDLSMIQGQEIESFDIDGVKLGNGKLLTWDRILRGKTENQAEFERYKTEVGLQLLKVRLCLESGDFPGAKIYADKIRSKYQDRKGEAALLVRIADFQAELWAAHQKQGSASRIRAIKEYLAIIAIVNQSPELNDRLPKNVQLRHDFQEHVSKRLLPIWFNTSAAKNQWPVFESMLEANSFDSLPLAAKVYFCSIAIDAGQEKIAMGMIQGIRSVSPLWSEILAVQLDFRAYEADSNSTLISKTNQLLKSKNDLSEEMQVTALYWEGMLKLRKSNPETIDESALLLLKIPALFGSLYPQIAAACLFELETAYNEIDPQTSKCLADELKRRYPFTYHGRLQLNRE